MYRKVIQKQTENKQCLNSTEISRVIGYKKSCIRLQYLDRQGNKSKKISFRNTDLNRYDPSHARSPGKLICINGDRNTKNTTWTG